MIEQIVLKNFKAVGETPMQLDLAPLTLLVGANGSGKSSVMEAAGVLAETAAGSSNALGLVVSGDRVSFPSTDLAFHDRNPDRVMRLGIRVRTDAASERAITYKFDLSKPRELRGSWSCRQALIAESPGRGRQVLAEIRAARLDAPLRERSTQLALGDRRWIGQPNYAERLLHPQTFQPSAGIDEKYRADEEAARDTMQSLIDYLVSRAIFLSGVRSADLFVREVGPVAVRTGRFGEQTIRVINIVQAAAKQRDGWQRIVKWANRFGMQGLTGGWVGNNELAVSFLDPETGTQLPLTSAAGGSQRLLPLLVDAFSGTPPRTIFVDEIEEAAHPDWQILIAELLAEIVATGNQVVATTHSPTMVLAVCAAIAKGLMKPEDVALYGLERGSEGATATRMPINKFGWIEGGWIETFARAERELLGSFLDGENSTEAEAVGAAEGRDRGGGHGRVSESPRDPSSTPRRRSRDSQRRRPPRK